MSQAKRSFQADSPIVFGDPAPRQRATRADLRSDKMVEQQYRATGRRGLALSGRKAQARRSLTAVTATVETSGSEAASSDEGDTPTSDGDDDDDSDGEPHRVVPDNIPDSVFDGVASIIRLQRRSLASGGAV